MSQAQTLFGILDLAQRPGLHIHVQRLAPHSARCLYEERLHPQVERVSPHLVELGSDDPLTRAWRTEGWGANWGILVQSPAGFHKVRQRLRHFTQARLPNGEGPVLFRFWDPRVFRSYLPLVEPAEIGQWFVDIDAYIAPTEDGGGMLRYSLERGALKIETPGELRG